MSQVTTMSRGAARPTVALAALAAIALSLAYLIQPTLAGVEPYQVPLHEAHQGADSSDLQPRGRLRRLHERRGLALRPQPVRR